MAVCGNGAGVSAFWRRPAWKYHTRARMTGPPRVHSYVVTSPPVRGVVSNGVSLVHDGLYGLIRRLPENWLPPLFVTALTTPPPKRPYSAEMPEVRTCTSSIASSMNRLF